MSESSRIGIVTIGRNEGERLVRCLASLRREGCPIVYVDSGSTDRSVEAAGEAGAMVVDLDLSTPFTAARARNAGIRRLLDAHPDIEFVQVLDGDCELVDGWIESAAEAMEAERECAIVAGRRREIAPEASIYNRLCDMEWHGEPGIVESCGGDALLRVAAWRAVGGYDDTIIAGEEPEMCCRLRRAGWRIRRLDRDMTLHDAAMTTFGQWWRRAVRCGHAYAEGHALHGHSPERFRTRQMRSIVEWTLIVPLLMLTPAWWTWGLSLLLGLGYAWQYSRIKAWRVGLGDSPRLAGTYAGYCLMGKFAELVGAARYWSNRLLGRRSAIIEYKHDVAADAAPGRRTVVYIGSCLPKRSETFVYREFLGLRREGLRMIPVSVHAPESGLGDPTLDALAAESIVLYGDGAVGVLRGAGAWMVRHPLVALRVLGRAAADAITGDDLTLAQRPKVVFQALAAMALIEQLPPAQVHHVHAQMAHVPTTIAMYAALALDVPFSFTGHAADLFRDHSLLRAKVRRASFVSCISAWHRAFYRRLAERSDAALPVIRCGVDTASFTVLDRAGSAGPIRLLGVGRLVPKKGFDVLLEAATTLVAGGVDCHVDLVGDGPERGRLTRLVESLGLTDRVTLHGALANERIRAMMQAADVFVLPCRVAADGDRDGIPVVLMEAMACGVPVVSGDLPTIRELVEHGIGGLLVAPGDVAELTDAIRVLVTRPDERRRLGDGGRRRVEMEFDLAVNVRRMRDAIERVGGPATPSDSPREDRPSATVATDAARDVALASSSS